MLTAPLEHSVQVTESFLYSDEITCLSFNSKFGVKCSFRMFREVNSLLSSYGADWVWTYKLCKVNVNVNHVSLIHNMMG